MYTKDVKTIHIAQNKRGFRQCKHLDDVVIS